MPLDSGWSGNRRPFVRSLPLTVSGDTFMGLFFFQVYDVEISLRGISRHHILKEGTSEDSPDDLKGPMDCVLWFHYSELLTLLIGRLK